MLRFPVFRSRDPTALGPFQLLSTLSAAGKPVHIWARVGRLPLLAAGNADGDIAMLESSRLSVLVHHDDGEREFAYDRGAERALAAAAERGWTVVSMRDDFAKIF